MSKRQPRISAALFSAGISLIFLSSCSRKEPAVANPSPSPALDERASPDAEPEPPFTNSLPHIGGPAGYAGSKECLDCHKEQYSSWHRSYHRTMTQFPSAETVKASFDHVVLSADGNRFTLTRTNDEFWVHVEKDEPAPDTGEPPPSADARIGLVTGSHHMQVFWVASGEGNAQIGFPFTWLIPERRWVPRKSTFIRPPDSPSLSELWNVSCSRCHTTAVQARVDSVRHIADTRVGELGISCEACHGPGQRHIERQRQHAADGKKDEPLLAGEIVHPKKIDPVRASQICGFCHSMKWFDKSEDWWEHGFRYRPGDDLEQTTPIIRPSSVKAIPGLAAYVNKNPALLHDFFWPDGMIRVSGRDYNGLIDSPCYKGGQFSCLSCHSLHSSEPAGQLARNKSGNGACLQCHEQFAEEAKLTSHTHHQAGSTGSECYNCHMPRTTYGVLKAIRSHQISSPKVADQLASSRPNACNLCHLDQTLAWTAEHLEAWFRQPRPALSRDQTQIAESIRIGLTGDAGQRAIAAWHFGWESALDVSKSAWVPPVLAQLLEDPYAAVRLIAERSLRTKALAQHLDEKPLPASQLFTRKLLLESWQQRAKSTPDTVFPAATLVSPSNPEETQAKLDQLNNQRDERPVRLRE